MLKLQITDNENYYGYGMWLEKSKDESLEPYFTGSDPGVSFLSSFNRNEKINITIISNTGNNVWEMKEKILLYLLK